MDKCVILITLFIILFLSAVVIPFSLFYSFNIYLMCFATDVFIAMFILLDRAVDNGGGSQVNCPTGPGGPMKETDVHYYCYWEPM